MRFLEAHDIWDWGLTNFIRIVKRTVYVKPALESSVVQPHWQVIPRSRLKRLNFKFVGVLAKGTSTKQARREFHEAEGK